jgi:hypothetical protein
LAAPLLERLADGRLRVAGGGAAEKRFQKHLPGGRSGRHGAARRGYETTSKFLVPICASTVRMDNRVDPDGYRRLPFRREEAAGYLTDQDGQFVEALVDGSYRLQTYHLCLKQPQTVRRLLELIGQVIKEGADGIVLRFCQPPQECHARDRHVGFVPHFKCIASQVPWMATYDQRVLALETHRHSEGDGSQRDAFRGLVAKARRLVKGFGRQRAFIVEAEADLVSRGGADARLIAPALTDLPHALGAVVNDREPPLLVVPRFDRPPAVEEVFRTAALCWLRGAACVLPRAALSRLSRGSRRLPDLGPRLTPPKPLGAVSYAVYAQGVVAVNGGDREQVVRLKLPSRYGPRALVDLRTGRRWPIMPGGTIPDVSVHDYAERQASDQDFLVRLPAGAGGIFCANGQRRSGGAGGGRV